MKKNKLLTILITFLALLSITAGCSSTSTNEAKAEKETPAASETKEKGIYTDGTYEGTSDAGNHPGLKVSVVVKDGNISEVNVLEHNETEGIGQTAIEKLPGLIVENQSTEVDSVTGASKTSTAVKEAVDAALSQAK